MPQRLFSAFPRGAPGVGLLLLRMTMGSIAAWRGAALIASAGSTWLEMGAGLLSMVVAAALIAGVLTPCAAAVMASGAAWSAAGAAAPLMAAQGGMTHEGLTHGLVFIDAVSLVMLGPGAFSIDARLFGRREIQIRETYHAPPH